jgi:phosphohistidine phosphatase
MQLLLLRHAKSAWKDAAVSDHERPLNRRGREAASAMGRYLFAEGLIPDLALVSSARRTQESWTLLIAAWPQPPSPSKVLRGLYLATAGQILVQVRRTPATVRRLLVLGHNPGLESLARALAGAGSDGAELRRLEQKFPTGALACFDCPADDWSALEKDGARLSRFVTPRALIGGADD